MSIKLLGSVFPCQSIKIDFEHAEWGRLCFARLFWGFASLALISTANAADLGMGGYKDGPYLSTAPWTGFYVGGEIGPSIGTSRKDFSATNDTTGDFNVDGVIGGGTVGYNMQWGHLVAGLEADFSGSSVSGSADCPNPRATCETNTSWLATVRPRLGYAIGQFLPYATGGFVVGDVNVHSFFKPGNPGTGVDFTKTQTGWTVGGGVETVLFPNWTVKAEYLFVQFDDTNVPSNLNAPTSTKLDENVFRVGVNYKLK